jgi:uncharacterized membrane protein required for colicin V production
MSYFDIGLVVILAGFLGNGLHKGLIRLLGQVVGLIVASYVSSHFYLTFYQWGGEMVNWSEGVEKFLSFLILFILVTSIIGAVFVVIEKLFNLVSIIPFTKLINRLLGGAVGLLEGSLSLGLILLVAANFHLFNSQITASKVTPWLIKIAEAVMPFLPKIFDGLKAVIG